MPSREVSAQARSSEPEQQIAIEMRSLSARVSDRILAIGSISGSALLFRLPQASPAFDSYDCQVMTSMTARALHLMICMTTRSWEPWARDGGGVKLRICPTRGPKSQGSRGDRTDRP